MTYTVTGDDLAELAPTLEKTPGVDMVAPFGTSLHVSGRDHAALRSVDRRNTATIRRSTWHESHPSLEDVFIELMGKARDNFQDGASHERATPISLRRLLGAAATRS